MFNYNPDANKDDGSCVAVCQWNTALAADDVACVAPADACGKDFPCADPPAQPGWSDGVVVNEQLSCAASDTKGVCKDARVKINGTTYEAECGEPNKTIGTGSHNVELFDPYDSVITGYYGDSSYIDYLLIAVNVATRDSWDDLTERNVYWSLLGRTPTINHQSLDAAQQAKVNSITSGANDVVLKNTGVYFLGVVGDPTFNNQLMFLKYCAAEVKGCTDPNALNYNPDANTDDSSCITRVTGCTDPNALNYDPRANTPDDSCVEKVPGCMDRSAINFNQDANVENGTCLIPKTLLGLDPYCVAASGGFSLGWTIENPNSFGVPATWSLDGAGGSGTLTPGTNFIGYTDDGPATHTMSVSWINGNASLSSAEVCSTNITTTTFTPPIPVTGAGVAGDSFLIPVTGVDLAQTLHQVALNLGLAFSGLGVALEGISRRKKK